MDKADLGNYRPVSIISNVCKVLCVLINERLEEQIEKDYIIGQGQNGFRRDRRGTDSLFSLCGIIDRSINRKEELYLAFIDIKKAFVRVNRGKLFQILEHIRIDKKITKILKDIIIQKPFIR